MTEQIIITTERLYLREFKLNDAHFILELVNTPSWLKHIGDRNVRTIEQANKYLKEGPIKSYREKGFGFWLVVLKESNRPIGLSGLIKRDNFENVDIGYALLPKYEGKGFGTEAARATMNYAEQTLKIEKIIAITDPKNKSSIHLLNKLDLRFEKTISFSDSPDTLQFAKREANEDDDQIETITDQFFNAFTNKNGKTPQVETLRNLFIHDGMLISNTSGSVEIFKVEDFILSRDKMLNDGRVTEFCENAIWHKTEIYGNVAQRFCLYQKEGKLNGALFKTKGVKTIQYIKQEGFWKISSVAWSDENELGQLTSGS